MGKNALQDIIVEPYDSKKIVGKKYKQQVIRMFKKNYKKDLINIKSVKEIYNSLYDELKSTNKKNFEIQIIGIDDQLKL